MSYAVVSILALLVNLIINHGFFKTFRNLPEGQKAEKQAFVRYSHFLIVANIYFAFDIGWGVLYTLHHVEKLFPILYSDAVFYFIFMFLSMLAWIRYVVAYLDKKGLRARVLLYAVWAMFIIGLVFLMVNRFHPFIFSFNEAHEYITESGRHIAFIMQIALYFVTSIYMLYVAGNASRADRIRYVAVGATCVVMDLFLIFQILNPKYPSYAMGLIIGICVIHSFVEAGERKEKEVYDNIARGLADNYDVLYYVNAEDSSFVAYEIHNIYGNFEMRQSGDDFYVQARTDINMIVHESDRDMVLEFVDRDNMIANMQDRRRSSLDYRITAEQRTHYVRMTVRKTADAAYFIIGIENIDAEVRREKQHLKALNSAKELARRDDLTGVRNKTAYNELEKSVQANIDNGMDYLTFALVVCDANNLKEVNDSEGHVAGDEYIKQSAAILCDFFDHSPVFRVGGDEFVVFLRGNDYSNRDELMKKLRDQMLDNLRSGSGPVLASGMSVYLPESDTRMSEVFERADKEMYEDKQSLKAEESADS